MKIKVGVFFGGQSVEHEVSIISGIQAYYAFDTEKYEPIPIYISKKNEMYVGSEVGKIESYRNIDELLKNSQRVILVNEGNQVKLIRYPFKKFGSNELGTIDVAFPVVHGTNVEDGTLQGYLRTLCIPYAGCDVTASALGMDKYAMKTVLKDNGIPVLDCRLADIKRYHGAPLKVIEEIEAGFSYPVIVKPVNLGSSVGIKIAWDREGLEAALDYAFEFAEKVLVERAITSLKEVNCSVLGDYEEAEASECEEPVNSDEILSYEDKYMSGGKGGKTGGAKSGGSKGGMSGLKRKLPAEIAPETREKIRSLAVRTFQALNCSGVSRIDFMIDMESGEIFVNEINTIPGSLSFYLWEATGMPYAELLDRMVKLALKRERERGEITYSFDTNLLAGVTLGQGAKGSKA